ncbi:MAG: hypothetical protein OEY85_06280, partial [Rhodospirillales bacterium]|nr:hypothetical protein [Rhodospirillales bacterium]
GLSRMEPDAIAEFLVAYMDDPSIPSPSEENPVVRMLKLATDDIKHFYYEAAMARPGTVTDIAIANWFWGETLMGLTFLQLRSVLAKQDDEKLLALANMALVPHHQKFRIKD